MDNKSIILKIQEMQVHIEMLNRKIEEQQPQEVAKVTVDKRAIAEQVVKQMKDKINNMIDKKVNMNFINKLYRNK
jgi:hypothetical protein